MLDLKGINAEKFLRGNTYFIQVSFLGKDGVSSIIPDADSVKINLLDLELNKVQEHNLNESHIISPGIYEYGFIPDENGYFVLEYVAKVQGFPVVKRRPINVVDLHIENYPKKL